MIKKLILSLTILSLVYAMPACNSSSSDYEYTTSSSVMVSAFSLKENKNVLDSLQNVFFSIDLTKGHIFNADSLPFGTDVSRLLPDITVVSTASAVSLEFPRVGMTDSVVNYLTNSTDSIDFSNGPVKLRVISQSGDVERVYEIRVNVHQCKPDTLAWKAIQTAALPSAFGALKAQRTVQHDQAYYCLTTDGTDYSLAVTADPSDPDWQTSALSLPFQADVESLTDCEGMLYMLSTAGELYQSADWNTWNSTGQTWSWIYGVYDGNVIGCDAAAIKAYPSMEQWPIPDDFPVKLTSAALDYRLPMGESEQLVLIGGQTYEGAYVSHAWAFDGTQWVKISQRPLPQGLVAPALVAYDLFSVTSSTWTPQQYPAIVLIGGLKENGQLNRTVYISKDWGMTWSDAPELMQLPAALPMSYAASAFVYSTIMEAGSRCQSGWSDVCVRSLPRHCAWEQAQSRVERPITQWECPAIYLVGGHDANGDCLQSMWRGQILRYTFQPVY